MIAAIEAAGYGVISPEEISEEEDAEQIARQTEIREQTRKFIVGVIFALPLFVWSMARDFSLIGGWSHAAWVNWLVEPCGLGQLAFLGAGHAGSVLYGLGLLCKRAQES
jgi:hypothetical protein